MFEPIFIVGFQRSGTTLLRMMLDAHPDLAIPLDTVGLWARYNDRLSEYGGLAGQPDRERLVTDLLAEERIRLWNMDATAADILERIHPVSEPDPVARYAAVIDAFHRTYAASRGKRLWGDKDPGNMERIHILNAWFPAARFVHIIRDGRDACLSQLKQSFGYDNFLDCGSGWCQQVTWVRRIGAILGPTRYREVLYEDLVLEPESNLRSICEFAELDFDPGMLDYHRDIDRSIPESKRHIWPLIDKPPQADNIGRWKTRITPASRLCFEKRAGPLLDELGYDVLPGPLAGGYLEEMRQFVRVSTRTLRRRLQRPAGDSSP